jgi:serine/threonine protein phosphatase 1
MRKFIVGDIHGGYRALIEVLDKVNFDYDNDMLISLGDVTDGWSEVAESIELLLKIKHLIYIKGNHDEWTERFLRLTLKHGPDDYNYNWYRQGGKATYYSYFDKPELVDKHLKFLGEAKLYHLDDENRLFLHAGLDPIVDLDKQQFKDVGQLNKGENALFYWDRYFWSHVVDRFKIGGTEEIWRRYEEIYIGHTPTINNFEHGHPVNIGNVWNMDTGATYDGRLSLMDIDTKEITQSEFVYKLYPDEMGRNGKFLAKE